MPKKIAVGYTRVSTVSQAEKGQSLTTQEEAIKDYCKKENLDLIKIYKDEGISGGSVHNRPALLQLLENVNKFDFVIVHSLSRLGRNVRELHNNVHFIKTTGAEIIFIKENIDLTSNYGKVMLSLLATIAEFEKDITGESSLENKIARCEAGIPATGKTPFGRNYDRDTKKWFYAPSDVKEIFESIAKRYLNGEGLRDIADTIPKEYKLTYSNILKVIHNSAGNTWEVRFKGKEDPVIFNIPPLLDSETLLKVKDRLQYNKTFNRHDIIEKYLLSGFIRCGKCGRALSGQIQRPETHRYKFYVHPGGKREKCRGIVSIRAEKIEEAVFRALFKNVMDEEGFKKAIEKNFPNPKARKNIEEDIKSIKKKLNKVLKDQDKICEALLNETLSAETVKKKDRELLEQKNLLEKNLRLNECKLTEIPIADDIRKQGELVRQELKRYFKSEKRYRKMTFEEKRNFLHTIFNGMDEINEPYGIYVEKKEAHIYEYFIYAKLLQGHSYIRKDDLDYDPDEKSPKYKTKRYSEHIIHKENVFCMDMIFTDNLKRIF